MIQVKIICPLSDTNLNIVNRILQNTTGTSNNIRIVNGSDSSFGMIIVDNTKFLKAELRDPESLNNFLRQSVYLSIQIASLVWNHINYFLNCFGMNAQLMNNSSLVIKCKKSLLIYALYHKLRTPSLASTGYS